MSQARWIELDGAVNVRDVGGLPTSDGGAVQPGRLIRSDNLQELSPRDVDLLVNELGVRTVADLRTGVEVHHEGPGPLTEVDDVEVRNLSLLPEAGDHTDVAADGKVILPWEKRNTEQSSERHGTSAVYLGYLDDRADSIIAALRLVAHSEGATIVHCAAGKDRTGTVVALALAEVGVEREAIITDYARSSERIEAIFDRLRATRTYARDLTDTEPHEHAPRESTMQRLLDGIDAEFGGPAAWLRAHGWTDEDAAALRHKLLDD
ncbi:MAG TPA: tyrosine-protein phosphatase [Jatrophihabitans sp.]